MASPFRLIPLLPVGCGNNTMAQIKQENWYMRSVNFQTSIMEKQKLRYLGRIDALTGIKLRSCEICLNFLLQEKLVLQQGEEQISNVVKKEKSTFYYFSSPLLFEIHNTIVKPAGLPKHGS